MLKTAMVLGLLSVSGSFAIDMFLPAMPIIAADLSASAAATQYTVTVYMLAFGVAQMIYGPWADQSGRKVPLITGVVLFIAGAVGSALATSVEALVAARFVMGFGGAAAMVVPRAIIRDGFTGDAATRLMALIMLIVAISPMLAPLAGTGVIALAGWRAIFWVICATSAFSLAVFVFSMPETLKPEHVVRVNLRSMGQGMKRLFTDAGFMGLTMVNGFGMASFFVFLGSASFVYTGQYGLTTTQFSLAFAVNAIGFFAASQAAGPLGARFGLNRMVLWGVVGFAVAAAVLLTITLTVHLSLFALIGLLILGNAFLGLVIPTSLVLALEEHGEIAGLASSLGGSLQLLTGGVMMAIGSLFFDGSATPMVIMIAISAGLALICALATVRPGRVAANSA
ncbi:major facilitator transporter [Actibacterium mucosum KCTC 23349]|uniref:Bcr/CflA family efflux transporter n=1 Tax=Actibacterium mucosum KCTC 23349 TaxID=1454373 RepID=A0A037ZGS3_9RHOB|nr:major facilitator transporter [Actibacterium mucosum KCTC 23349]